jgi:integrase
VFEHPVNYRHLPFKKNPVEAIEKYSEVRPRRYTLPLQQQVELIDRLEQETPGVTDFVKLAVTCGLRQGEQFNRLKTDVDTESWCFVIPHAKHQKEPKVIPIPPSVRPSVLTFLRSPGPWLIPDPTNPGKPFPVRQWYKTKYRRAVREVGLPKGFNWHSLRHTFASRLLQSGATTKTVRHAGGWSSERMVDEVYGHLENEFVMDAMERAATVFSTAPDPKVRPIRKP